MRHGHHNATGCVALNPELLEISLCTLLELPPTDMAGIKESGASVVTW